jgi:hypothetical protein
MRAAGPLTPALSPNRENVLGERVKLVATLTQGDALGSCLALALGYHPLPRWGSMREKRPPAASQMSNLRITAVSQCHAASSLL